MSQPERTYMDPSVTMETERYWEATKNKSLLVKKCLDCGEVHFYPRAICPHCSSSNTDWVEASGKGRIYSFSVMRRAPIPYAMAYVTIEEGVTMMTNIVECDFDSLRVNDEVEVVYRNTENGESLPFFRPISSGN